MSDEILEFDFEGVQPAVFGSFVTLPKGEYNLQCTSCRKFFTGESKGNPDSNKPNLEFKFQITKHPDYEGKELRLNHSLLKDSRQFLLNTLMCLIPEFDWQKGGIKVPLSQLITKVQGRPCNGVVDWVINSKDGKNYVNNELKGLKPFDESIKQPMPSEGNPPVISNKDVSPIVQQASGGVSKEEAEAFLNSMGGGTPSTPAPSDSGNFFDDPF